MGSYTTQWEGCLLSACSGVAALCQWVGALAQRQGHKWYKLPKTTHGSQNLRVCATHTTKLQLLWVIVANNDPHLASGCDGHMLCALVDDMPTQNIVVRSNGVHHS